MMDLFGLFVSPTAAICKLRAQPNNFFLAFFFSSVYASFFLPFFFVFLFSLQSQCVSKPLVYYKAKLLPTFKWSEEQSFNMDDCAVLHRMSYIALRAPSRNGRYPSH